MAKKTVASLQTSSKRLSKAIKMVKSPKSGAYIYVESIMAPSFHSKNQDYTKADLVIKKLNQISFKKIKRLV
jgi:hypothetical protein